LTLETTKKKLETQNARLEEAKKAVQIGAISEQEFNALKRSVQYTETDISKLNGELEETAQKIKSLGGINLDKLSKVGSTMTKYVTVPILGAVSALGALTIKSMETADAIADNAAKVYLSTDAYQKWSHAFKILAVDETIMQKAFIKMNAVLGDIASGSGSGYNDYLNMIGLSTEDLIGLNSDQAFELIRDSLSALEDETLRVAIANEIFGDKVGSELAQVLGSTAEQITNLKSEAEELGLVSEEEAKTAGEFTDSLDNLKLSVTNLGVTIGTAFVPILEKVVDTIQGKIVPEVRNVVAWWGNLSDSTKKIIGVVVALLASIGPILTIVAKAIPLFNQFKNLLLLFKSGGLFKGFSLGKLAIVALIAVMATLLLKNEKFKELLGKIFTSLQRVLSPLVELINKLISKLMPIIEAIFDVVETLIDSLVNLLDGIIDPLIETLEVVIAVVAVLLDALIGLIEEILPPIIDILKLVTDIVIELIPIIKIIIDLVGNVLAKTLTLLMSLMEPIKKILELVIDIIGVIIEAIVQLIEAIIKPLNKVLEVLGAIIQVVANILGVLIDIIAQALTPVLQIIIAILAPILELIEVIIEAIASVMEILTPLIDLLLQPLINQLDLIKFLLEAFSPLLKMIGEVIGILLAPALELLFKLLEPILWVFEKIIDATKWLIENIAKAFEGVGKVFGDIGDFFGDLFSGKLFQSNSSNATSSYTTNNVTVNTTSSVYDINSINKALGGAY
ncbi:MAG: hypothetical protein WC215_05350, partial [Bacilli bacterium]